MCLLNFLEVELYEKCIPSKKSKYKGTVFSTRLNKQMDMEFNEHNTEMRT